jgi:hypothetical protein
VAVQGRLAATVTEGSYCDMHTLSRGTIPFPTRSRCPAGWLLSDLADPRIVRGPQSEAPTPALRLDSVGKNSPFLHAALACNRSDAGKPVMPAGTRFDLPDYDYEDAAALNATLEHTTVVVFGGQYAPDYQPELFETPSQIVVTHACRIQPP